jgi:hypothetical protein
VVKLWPDRIVPANLYVAVCEECGLPNGVKLGKWECSVCHPENVGKESESGRIMKADSVIAAFRHFVRGEQSDAIGILHQIEAGEVQAGRHAVANRIRRLFSESPTQPLMRLPNAPDSLEVVAGTRPMDTVVLPDQVREAISDLILEWKARDVLAEHGLPVRRVVLLSGPSGNGKTTLAHAIATELGLPLARACYDQLIDSHLGSTGGNIAEIFRFASETPCVVLIDEADALVASRIHSDEAAGREGNRIVSSAILGLDGLTNSIVVFATNAADMIDPAIKRRCALQLELPPPGLPERVRMCEILRQRWPVLAECDCWADAVDCKSLAAVEDFVLSVARKHVIGKAGGKL